LKTDTQPILAYLLVTLFIGLKLTHQIEWSWWLVLAPLWIYPLATFAVGFALGLIGALKKRRRKNISTLN